MRQLLLLFVFFLLSGCVDNPTGPVPEAPPLSGEAATFTIVIPPNAEPGLEMAASDLAEAAAKIGGGERPAVVNRRESAETSILVAVQIEGEDEELAGPQAYRLDVGPIDSSHGVKVQSRSHTGAMYGLYHLIADMGVRYHHPEETFFPDDPSAKLPWDYDEQVETPHFELRGFHEHTQHPIPMSDFYLRPEPEFRPYVSNYLRWLARNRQNMASIHMLKTVDLPEWEPYVADIVGEAHAYGIRIGLVISFVDEQQNNYKILADPELADDEQIADSLDRFHELGFDFFTLQIGSSEFTKPDEEAVVRWLNSAVEHAETLEPSPDIFSWVHISCDLRTEDDGNFWHLPGEADPGLGVWVHTVMFHDLQHPAPVYGCENFQHQAAFIEQEEQERPIVYFPETAWWLGFDNNAPIALPITGWTRAWDIQQGLEGHDVRGHVTFTSGREWTYWQYDHYLTRGTWDAEIGWPDYLDWIGPMYGEHAESVLSTLMQWTELQRQNFFEDNPLVYFYVAGELRQDEVGAQAGVFARRPKRSYREVLDYTEQEFEEWKSSEFDLLGEMLTDHLELRDALDAPSIPTDESPLTDVLYYEFYTALDVYVNRIQHAIALYEGVMAVREWVRAREDGAMVDGPEYVDQLDAARAQLEEARTITEQTKVEIQSLASFYRYPDGILIEEKPETLTSYPYGYLEQAHTAHFWTRRDDQLERLIDDVFFERPDEWANEPDVLFFAEGDGVELVEPDNSLASNAISQFIPRMLFGLSGTLAPGSDDVTLTVGQDYNENFIPDSDTEETFDVTAEGTTWTASGDVYTFIARNDTGEQLGDGLSVFDPRFELSVTGEGEQFELGTGELAGNVAKTNLVNLIVDVAGIDEDGVENLLKAIFDIPQEEKLPALLPFRFRFTFQPAP